jgi:uncharacterized membrane-anchored protein
MLVVLYLMFVLPVLAGLFYLLAVVRVWRSNRVLAIVMLFFSPAGLYALLHYWREKDDNPRVPIIASLGSLALWCCLILWGANQVPPEDADAQGLVESADDEGASESDDSSNLTDKLHLSIALANLPHRGGRIEIAPAHASIDVPAHFNFIDRANLQTLYAGSDGGPSEATVGWLVHESVNLADDNAWYVDVAWVGDGFVTEGDLATRTRDALLADAKRATEQISEDDGRGYSLVRYAEEPALDETLHSATWVEDLAYTGEAEHKLDCYAAKLGRSGAFLYSINEVSMRRQELCLRAVRLAATRTEFASGHAYSDHSGLFDHKARFDLPALVTGTFVASH